MNKPTRRLVDSKYTLNIQNIVLGAVIIAVAVIHFAVQMSFNRSEDLMAEKSSPTVESVPATVNENLQVEPVQVEIAQNTEQNEISEIAKDSEDAEETEINTRAYQSKQFDQKVRNTTAFNAKNYYQAKRSNAVSVVRRKSYNTSNSAASFAGKRLAESRAERLRRTEMILTGEGE